MEYCYISENSLHMEIEDKHQHLKRSMRDLDISDDISIA